MNNPLVSKPHITSTHMAQPALWLVGHDFGKLGAMQPWATPFPAIRDKAGWIKVVTTESLFAEIKAGLDGRWSRVFVCPAVADDDAWYDIVCDVRHQRSDEIVIFEMASHRAQVQHAYDAPDHAVNRAFLDALDRYEADRGEQTEPTQWQAPIDLEKFAAYPAGLAEYQQAFVTFWTEEIHLHRRARQSLFDLVNREEPISEDPPAVIDDRAELFNGSFFVANRLKLIGPDPALSAANDESSAPISLAAASGDASREDMRPVVLQRQFPDSHATTIVISMDAEDLFFQITTTAALPHEFELRTWVPFGDRNAQASVLMTDSLSVVTADEHVFSGRLARAEIGVQGMDARRLIASFANATLEFVEFDGE